MSGNLNKVLLIGNIGGHIKIHYFSEDSCVSRFSLATSEYYINKEKEKITNTEWHTIVVKNKLAEYCEKHLNKGDRVYLEGKIRTRVEGKEGNDCTTEIVANELMLLNSKEQK